MLHSIFLTCNQVNNIINFTLNLVLNGQMQFNV